MPVVSIYPHIKETKNGKIMELEDVFGHIQKGTWSEQIDSLRTAVKTSATEKEIGDIKNKLNYFTASGVFSERKDAGLLQHSGILALDFDKLEEYTTIAAAWEAITNDKYTHYAFLSCSGRGICALVHIDGDKHLESFHFFKTYYQKHYSLILDDACKDVSRPRYISYDPNAYTNSNYETLSPIPATYSTTTIDSDDEKYDWVKADMDRKMSFIEGQRHHYLITMAHYLNKVGVSQGYMEPRFYSDFSEAMQDDKEIARCIKSAYDNVSAFGTYQLSKSIKDLPPEFAADTKKIYARAFLMNADGVMWDEGVVNSYAKEFLLSAHIVRGIFQHVFKVNADEFDINNKPEIAKVEVFIRKRWKLLKNDITKRIQTRIEGVKKPDGSYTRTTFELVNEHNISRELMHASFKFPVDKIRSLLESNFVPSFNPFIDYFTKLPAWSDTEPDYISLLADHVAVQHEDDLDQTKQGFWKTQFKKALVRTIACAIGGIENRIIITLVGEKQETGKSTFIRFLCPPDLHEYYTESELLAGEKDSDMQLSENMIWNLEELAALNANEINRLKATISKSSVKQRRAYDRHHDVNPRRVTFWASTNNLEFLSDDTNTRWLCFQVHGINHDYNNKITGVRNVDINKVWAQAYALYQSGFAFNLTKEEQEQRDKTNKDHEKSGVEKDLILRYFEPTEDGWKGEFVSKTDIEIKLATVTEGKVRINSHAIVRAMNQLPFQKTSKTTNGTKIRGWYVKDNTTVQSPIKIAKESSLKAEYEFTPNELPENEAPLF